MEDEVESKQRHRAYSDQDIKTRNARASIPGGQKHRSAASYPVYSPPSHSRLSSAPTYLPWGTMDRPTIRPVSSGSSVATYSTFTTRSRSPLSISSSIESLDSGSVDRKNEYLSSRKRIDSEPIVPAYAQYGALGEGRKQNTAMPPRPGQPFRSMTTPVFGKAYIPREKGAGFRKLPEEILLVILAELKKLHLDVGSISCATCWARDMITLGLTSKKWWAAARIALYEDIQIIGHDSIIHTKKKYKMKYGTRLKLLRRTLRSRPDLAEYVKSLKVPAMPETAKKEKDQEEYLDLVASLIMACPNLEKVPGLYPAYGHQFSRLVQALSTREKLTEKIWVINSSRFQRQHRYNLSADGKALTPVLTPSPLLPEQCNEFFNYHSNWSNLKTLVLHCNPGGTIDSLLFTDIFHSLPSLENVHVSNFPASSFDDSTLLALPALKCLRLDNLPGITSFGLENYASPSRTDGLTSLSLISISGLTIPVLARLFTHLKALTQFTISQVSSPSLPAGTQIFLHPYLSSTTLQYIHWEFTNPEDDIATEILAKAISFNGFPALRTIRAPTDHEGSLQRLCRPRKHIEMASDRYRNLTMPLPHSHSMPNMSSPTRSTFSEVQRHSSSFNSIAMKSPTRSAFSLNLDRSSSPARGPSPPTSVSGRGPEMGEAGGVREKGMSLSTARRMAQHRVDNAHLVPQFHIIVWDENGTFIDRQAVGFCGDLSSKIFYTLKPDIEGSDETVAMVEGAGGLLDGGDEVTMKDGCTGNWNLEAGNKYKDGKKGKERWWHVERGRWKEVHVGRLFGPGTLS